MGYGRLLVNNMGNLLSRKFIFALLVLILSFGLVIQGSLKAEVWTQFAVMIGGLYIIGNAVEHVSDKM